MKKLIFDLSVCQPIGTSKYHGGGVYGYIVLKKLIREHPELIDVYYDHTRFVDETVNGLLIQNNIRCFSSRDITLLNLYKSGNYVGIYSPLITSTYKELFSQNVPLILTMHGLRALEMNRDRYEYLYSTNIKELIKINVKNTFLYNQIFKKYHNQYKALFSNRNVRVITVSQHSKYSMLYHYPHVSSDKIIVKYSPSTTEFDYVDVIPYSPGYKYFLLVSANRWLKNSYRAICAFDNLFDRYSFDFKVVVVGFNNNRKIFNRIKHKNNFVFLDYVPKEQLESIYKGAYSLVYPTLNEGFGYPPLEAMKYGVPVISSPFASITEICEDAVIYANPYSEQEIANRILMLLDDSVHDKYSLLSESHYKYIEKKQYEDLESLIAYITDFDNYR